MTTPDYLSSPYNDALQRALSGDVDFYEITAGEKARPGFAGVVLMYRLTVPGEELVMDQKHLDAFRDCDPQAPQKLNNGELFERQQTHAQALRKEHELKTEEFKRLTGTHDII